jgi:hypothetical protein
VRLSLSNEHCLGSRSVTELVNGIFFLAAAPAASGPRVVKPSSAPSGGHTAAPAARPAGPSSAPGAKKVVKSGGAAAAGSGAKKPGAGKSGSPPAALSGGIASESDISLEECEARSEEIFSGIKQLKLYSAKFSRILIVNYLIFDDRGI